MTFDVKAKCDVQIGFFEAVPTMSKMYAFNLGADMNKNLLTLTNQIRIPVLSGFIS